MQKINESYLPNMLKSVVEFIPMKEIMNFSDGEFQAYNIAIELCIESLKEILEQNEANIL